MPAWVCSSAVSEGVALADADISVDARRLSAGARSSGLEVHVHTDNTLTHRPLDLTGEEKAVVHAAIAGVMTSVR